VSPTVGDHLLERLAIAGVQRIYGYPGDGINGIMGAMNRAGGGIDGSGPLEFVQVRHEEMAAFMACAQAKFTGEVRESLARVAGSSGADRRSRKFLARRRGSLIVDATARRHRWTAVRLPWAQPLLAPVSPSSSRRNVQQPTCACPPRRACS